MIPALRDAFNASFRQERYLAMLDDLNRAVACPADFRISETPLFLSEDLTRRLLEACDQVLDQVASEPVMARSGEAIPPGWKAPNQDPHPQFLQVDFAVCQDESGAFVPRLVELQGFPSVYCFQALVEGRYRRHYGISPELTAYFGGLDTSAYLGLLRRVVVGDCDPENVVLVDLEPGRQKTRIDFACTESMLGVRSVCLSELVKRGRKLHYLRDGREIPVERIFNRIVADELDRRGFQYRFRLTDDLDVTWLCHPNWYFAISKFTLPFLSGTHVPETHFVHELPSWPEDLSEYVLKPLFSFAGSGVVLDVTSELLDALPDPQHYILQRKVDYAPLVRTPDGFARAEVRMMFLWTDRPRPVVNLVRMSKGRMMGVDFNTEATWVGTSIGFHPVTVTPGR